MLDRRAGGPPFYTYQVVPGVPPVTTMRVDKAAFDEVEDGHAHAHDFLVIAYFERGGGALRLAEQAWPVAAGDVYLIAPGEVLGSADTDGLKEAEGWGVYFPTEALGEQVAGAILSWRAHPLLFPFVRGQSGGAQRLTVPLSDRATWSERFQALDRELHERRDGYREATLAHLTLLLVDVARLAADVAGSMRLKGEPLLANVFAFIEDRYPDPISLKDVAWAVSLTPAHLTTVVRRKTGRTVQEWITERRMAAARRLLVETDLSVAEVGRQVGYRSAGYFVRTFRRAHGLTPLAWRRAGRP